MWRLAPGTVHRAGLFALAGAAIAASGLAGPAALAQIYLAPTQQFPQGSRVSIDLGGLRCNADGGALLSPSLSAGAYPDQWGNTVTVAPNANNTAIGSQSSLLALVTLNIPLARSQSGFHCQTLLKDAQIKARIDNLRQLVEENVISESQYQQALRSLFAPELAGHVPAAAGPAPGARLQIPSTGMNDGDLGQAGGGGPRQP
ncbi:MAG: hypothetical protein FJ077_04665 [Cyanobacteria bacterium K_DeepCast_35m_m2_023]|nr:hypothetical protein [Cyanobacteria bacterium K_DeepCast_35m_m2_023]